MPKFTAVSLNIVVRKIYTPYVLLANVPKFFCILVANVPNFLHFHFCSMENLDSLHFGGKFAQIFCNTTIVPFDLGGK